MGADAAWRETGFVLRVSSCFYLACVENNWRTVCWKLRWFHDVVLTKIMRGENMISCFTTQHRQNVVSGCWISLLMGIFAFTSAKVEIWFQLECAPGQLVSVVTAKRHFYVATFSLWYPNLIIYYLNL